MKSLGHAPGGIVVLYKDATLKLLKIHEITPHWIIAKFVHGSLPLTIIAAYAPPKICLSTYTELLSESIWEVWDSNPGSNMVVLGDFNGRIGMSGELYYDNDTCPNFSSLRRSLDSVTNSRGKTLLSTFKQLSLTVLNGRSKSDTPGEYTFMQKRAETAVMTTIDLALANSEAMNIIEDFWIGEQFGSDHRMMNILFSVPTRISLTSLPCQPRKIEPRTKLTWDPLLKDEYLAALDSYTGATELSSPQTIYENITAGISKAAASHGMTHTTRNYSSEPNQPWYDKECKEANRARRQLLRTCKATSFSATATANYLESKRSCAELFKQKKKYYTQVIADRLANANKSIIFWKTVNSFRRTTPLEDYIGVSGWECFYDNIAKERNKSILSLTSVDLSASHEEFTMEDLNMCLKKFKNRKAPGSDGISAEFYKYLPQHVKEEMLKLFNSILHFEKLPSEWSVVELVMLHKKGDRGIPANYRGIALIQVICKIFTQLLLARLEAWSDANGIIPEFQAGFRKQRGCIDHLFTLHTLVYTQLQKENRVYAAFIDYTRAFDSVNHNKLWSYLLSIGFPGKYLRIISQLYQSATMHVRTPGGCTRKYDITTGVLQGETLSPFLFSLYLNDMEEFINNRVRRGVQLCPRTKVHLLAYADDVVLFGDSSGNLQEKLNALADYCEMKELTVNIEKTKTMIFNPGGRHMTSYNFTYNNHNLENVRDFTYLGLKFVPSGRTATTVATLKSKANTATIAAWKILVNSKLRSWDSRRRILDALCLSVLQYGSQIWGLEHCEEIERFNLMLYKKLLLLPKATPGYLIRLECGLKPMLSIIFKHVMTWFCKCILMSDERLPKICVNILRHWDEHYPRRKRNWISRIRSIVSEHESVELWLNMDAEKLSESIERICNSIAEKQYEKDIAAATNSHYSPWYSTLRTHVEIAPYLTMDIALAKMRIIAQARLSGSPFLRLISEGSVFRFDPKSKCPICREDEKDDLSHFLTSCIILRPLRQHHSENMTLASWMTVDSKPQALSVFNFITQALRLRSWSLGE